MLEIRTKPNEKPELPASHQAAWRNCQVKTRLVLGPVASRSNIWLTSLSVALGGFLMGFDASVISGVVGPVEAEFKLSKLELGWAVASLTLTSALGMLGAGPLSDRIGRVAVLRVAATLFLVSALACAGAPNYGVLVLARMLGGFAVGGALIVAPMYIAEAAPAGIRGRVVSLNQLNIVIGISAAFFSNYLLLRLSQAAPAWIAGELLWRWMLGIEALPAVLYLLALRRIPESPRWLQLKGRHDQAREVLARVHGGAAGEREYQAIKASLAGDASAARNGFGELLRPHLRLVLLIGITVGVVQQATGINAVFFYAPMIFEQSGLGADAALLQAALVGVVNLVFTLLALALVDRVGRKPLLQSGLAGIAIFMLLLSYTFSQATFQLSEQALAALGDEELASSLAHLANRSYENEGAFKAALDAAGVEAGGGVQSMLVSQAVEVNNFWVLGGILGFVACFAFSAGPIMWVLFSELFPNYVRAVAISLVGLVNSGVSFLVQLLFPWQLASLGSSATFFVYGVVAVAGFAVLARIMPETGGRSLEEIELALVGRASR